MLRSAACTPTHQHSSAICHCEGRSAGHRPGSCTVKNSLVSGPSPKHFNSYLGLCNIELQRTLVRNECMLLACTPLLPPWSVATLRNGNSMRLGFGNFGTSCTWVGSCCLHMRFAINNIGNLEHPTPHHFELDCLDTPQKRKL